VIKLYLQPQPSHFPERGGVREHLIQVHKQLQDKVEFVSNPNDADILHVESAYPIPRTNKKLPVVHINHGGFIPSALPVVIDNLQRADKIISVAQWMVDKFFNDSWKKKTVVIPNGINEADFENLPSNNLEPGFILYAKEWNYYFEDFQNLVYQRPDIQFVTTVWSGTTPFNVKYIGLTSREQMKSILSKAGCLLLTGSEVCPTMLLEAWYLKVPVVAKDIDGSRELMMPKFEFNLYSDDLIPKIDFALTEGATIGSRGKVEVMQKYLWSDLIKRYLEVYEKVLEES
jgi:glycosyltransferase involved in cell wall biosynthesis